MLRQEQSITYKENDNVISELNPNNDHTLKKETAVYIRLDQPFTTKGCPLSIPKGDHNEITGTFKTSPAMDYPKIEGNRLIIETICGDTYAVEYHNIDLERVLQDGRAEGVNQWVNYPNEVPDFPYPVKSVEHKVEEAKKN